MKKTLLLLLFFATFVNIFSQNSVMIVGESYPIVNGQYNYRITTAAHGVSGTKAKWTIENGKFTSVSGGTTLEQNVDIMNINVIWDKVNTVGILKYYYKNGSNAAYEGQISVSINPTPPPSGKITISGSARLHSGDKTTYNFHGLATDSKVTWQFENYYLNQEQNDDHDGRSITLRVKPFSGIRYSVIEASSKHSSGDYDRFINVKLIGDPVIIQKDNSNVCLGNAVPFTINEFHQEYAGANVVWTAGEKFELVSAQTPPDVTFKATGIGYGKINAVLTEGNKVYKIETKQWIGSPKVGIDGIEDEQSLYSTYTDISNKFAFGETTAIAMKGLGIENTSAYTNFEWRVMDYGVPIFGYGGGISANPIEEGKASMGRVAVIKLQPRKYYGPLMFKIRGKNTCGWSDWKYITWSGTVMGGSYKSMQLDEMTDKEPSTVSIRIYSLTTGSIVYTEKNIMDFNIENTGLSKGIYILEKTDENGNVTRIKVAKK